VYGIVKQSGGHIAVESASGHGTTFRIWLPAVAEATPAIAAALPASLVTAGTETILLVEDEEAVSELLNELLFEWKRRGATIQTWQEHLGEVGRAELAPLGRIDPGHEPGRSGVRSDDAGQESIPHPPTSSAMEAKANALAGSSTNHRRRRSSPSPWSTIAFVNPTRSQTRPGPPPWTS
jgi:hypothetical protein